MKKPKPDELRHDMTESMKIRAVMRRPQGVKITINIDSESLDQLRELAEQSGVPYQRLLNKILKEGLGKSSATESRLGKLEKELERLKKKLAA